MGWTCLSANSVCGITSSSKNNLDRRENEKKMSGKKVKCQGMKMQGEVAVSSASIPDTGVNYEFT